MRLTLTATIMLVFGAGIVLGWGFTAKTAAQAERFDQCGSGYSSQVRTTLYFGTAKPKGTVSELEWQLFLRDEVTSRFPDGLTVWNAEGQWRAPNGSTEHEHTKILLLVHQDTPAAREAIRSLTAKYRKAFDQQSVLLETARVCVAS